MSQGYLHPGEELLCGLRVNLKGTARGIGIAALGGAAAAVIGGNILKKGQDEAKSAGIPFSQQMALGVTARRILIWKRSQLSGKPTEILGEIPLSDIRSVDFAKAGLGDKLTLHLGEDKSLQLESVKIDKGALFVEALQEVLP